VSAAATTWTPAIERVETRNRTRWAMAASAVLHAALLLWLVLLKPSAHAQETLTEITLLAPGDLDPDAAAQGSAASAARAAATVQGAQVAQTENLHFTREPRVAEYAPDPQAATDEDRIEARLAALQRRDVAAVAAGAVGAPASLWSGSPGVAQAEGSGGSPIALHRGGGTGSGIALSIGGGKGTASASGAPAVVKGNPALAAEPAATAEATVRRTLAGASLAGPIADRRVLRFVKPEYPDWAKRDGVEGSVTLYFIVRADGTIQENVLVQKTAGFEDFDDRARSALRAWRFEPLRAGRTGEQWGTITFHFRLGDG